MKAARADSVSSGNQRLDRFLTHAVDSVEVE